MFFIFSRVIFNNSFTISVVTKNAQLKLVLAIPTGAPITAANNAIDIVTDKQLKTYQNSQKKQYIC